MLHLVSNVMLLVGLQITEMTARVAELIAEIEELRGTICKLNMENKKLSVVTSEFDQQSQTLEKLVFLFYLYSVLVLLSYFLVLLSENGSSSRSFVKCSPNSKSLTNTWRRSWRRERKRKQNF